MISRAARVPRICLACRTCLAQRSTVPTLRFFPIRNELGQSRRFASGSDSKDIDIDEIIARRFSVSDAEKRQNSGQANGHDNNELNTNKLSENNGKSTELGAADQLIVEEIDNFLADVTGGPKSSKDGRESTAAANDSVVDPSMNSDFTFTSDTLDESGFPPWHRRRRQIRHPLLQNRALEVSALGVQADAIIVRNPNKMQLDKPHVKEIAETPIEDSIANIDWSSLKIDSENADAEAEAESREEVWRNINELRPDTKALRMRDYEKLSLSLIKGFTTDQLRDYIRDFDAGPEIVETKLGDYHWIAKQLPWTPFKTIEAVKLPFKLSLAHKIISQKWKIKIQEHVDDLGQTFVWVDPHYFPFLSHGKGAFLKNAKNDFLDEANNEKLSTTSNECRINITSKKVSTYAILERLDRYFKRIHHRMLPITQFTKHVPKAAELRDLAKITSTSLKLHKKGKDIELQVSWFGGRNPDSSPRHRNEDKADTVLRLLTTRPARGLVDKVECIPSLDSSNGIFIEFNRETRSRAWKDKLQKWFRCVSPVGATNEGAEPSLGLADTASLQEYFVGERDVQSFTTATFGHILHSEAQQSTAKLAKKRRILSPVTPHPATFSALKSDNDEAPSQTTTIVLKFAPHVDRSLNPEKVGPSVRINIPITPDADINNFQIPKETSAECVVPWNVDDVMLPSQSVDVRLTNERRLPLDISQPGLQEYLNTSHFDLLGARLKTPKDVTLSIPKQWLGSNPKSTKASGVTVDLLYDFRGIEIHQAIEMEWKNHTFRYSAIEAGQHGGKRREITLQAGRPGTPTKDFRGQQRADFLQLVEGVATGKFFSWDEGFRLIKAQQFEDYSYDLPAQEFGEDFIVSEVDAQEAEEKEPVEWKKKNKPATEQTPGVEIVGAESILSTIEQKPAVEKAAKTNELSQDAIANVIEKKPVSDQPGLEPSESDFFKHFSSRAGDQLDQFGITSDMSASKKRRLREKAAKRAKDEVVDDDENDPFRIPARRSRAPVVSSSTETDGSVTNTLDHDNVSTEQVLMDDEWDDELYNDEDFEDIEDNELSTAEIEAELGRLLGLENFSVQPSAPSSEQPDVTKRAGVAMPKASSTQHKEATPTQTNESQV